MGTAATFILRHGFVKYRPASGMHKGYACELCGGVSAGLDHCQFHGWVRGVTCTQCNQAMVNVERRKPGNHAPKLLRFWANCPDCAQDGPWTPGERAWSCAGRTVSVWLDNRVIKAWKASRLSLAELVEACSRDPCGGPG
jgi:hypothetical protein